MKNIIDTEAKRLKLVRSLPALVTLILIIINLVIWHQTTTNTKKAYQDYFDFRVREAIINIENRLSTYQQVLFSARGLYDASRTVSRADYHSFVNAQHLEENFPGIQGVGFSLILSPDMKNPHISAVRAEGFPEYNIRPEGARDLYTSIVYLEPLADRNLRAFGYDMFSEPVRREAMERSRDTDSPAMSGKVRLVQESGKQEQAGFLIYVPVYHNGLPHDTLSNRRANIIGWVYSPFRMNDLMEGIQGEQAHDIDLEIFDGRRHSYVRFRCQQRALSF
ncbi:CHASE domain-containing protein [Amphritea pacifica]|uniref:CHASE domain-containing protein n=1 Tax=Amphritea pacifica TaxID=2811233 RepID=UPI001965FD15|nr:CHASE domain-containing protein [Amphritea pacifica]MBN1007646.1 CHASE domain-containing protein [Amphritea pacifica]